MPRQAWIYVTTFPDGTTYTRTTTNVYTHTIIGRDTLGWFVWRYYTDPHTAQADYRALMGPDKARVRRNRYDWKLIPVAEDLSTRD